MPDPKRTAYERLKELLVESETANYQWVDSGESTQWRQTVQSALRRLFGEKCEQLKAFKNVKYVPIIWSTSTPGSVFAEEFMAGMRSATAIIRSALQEYEDYERSPEPSHDRSEDNSPLAKSRNIFVVHGHDNEMKEAVARFLENLELAPIILHEQASGGDTIIEKLERHRNVSYAIILLSPDDVGRVNNQGKALRARARQNVILELGFFMGALGRSHVFTLLRGDIEHPSDLLGVIYVKFDDASWKMKLLQELKHNGFDIDTNKLF